MAATSPDFPSALAGRYQIERELGRGGMATVYLARGLQQNTLVALKLLRPELSGVVGAERFAREIAIATRLQHPHILPIHDSGTLTGLDGVPLLFYTMPYVAGRSLRAKLNEESQLSIEEAIAIARQVAEALDHAHRQGIVHRDIKPENILLGGYPSRELGAAGAEGALVADFGIARAADAAGERLTQTGLALGTPAYMSPEQATGTIRLDGRADVYALGCVLYEMLAGEPPFTGPTPQAVLARHAMDRVPSLRTLRPEVSAGLARVVRRALAKIPADRYPTAKAFADALAAPETERTDGAPASGVTRMLLSRRWILAAAAGGLPLVAAATLALVTRARRMPPIPLDPTAVAVAPFRVSSSDPAVAYLREGIVDLLATQLGGTMAVKPVDSRTVLDAWHRAGGGSSDAAGQPMARALGAGQLVQGEIVTSGSRATLSATLSRVADGKETARLTVEGPTDSLTPLVARLGAQVLARAAGEPEERLPALAAAAPGALRSYLDGWALVRRTDGPEALKRFEASLQTDSSFALAALGGARAVNDGTLNRDAPMVKLAWRVRDRLTAGDRAYLTAILGPRYPEASLPHEYREAAELATRMNPRNADAWFWSSISACGDVSTPDKVARCRLVTRRALELDSLSVTIVGGAVERSATLGDTAAVRQAIRQFVRLDTLSRYSVWLQWTAATMLGDTTAARRLALSDSMVSTGADQNLGWIWPMAAIYLSEGRGFADVQAAMRRTRAIAPTGAQRGNLEMVQHRLDIARGRSTGIPPISWWDDEYRAFELVSSALFADGDPAPLDSAAAASERRLDAPVSHGCCAHQLAAAEAALASGRMAVAHRALQDMERFARSRTDELYVYAFIVAAQIAARERSPSAGMLLHRLDSTLTDRRDYMDWSLLYGNLIVARLFEERGDYAAALRAIRRRDPIWTYPEVISYHRDEGRIAAEAGDTTGAIRAYQRYLRIRADAEARLQPQVQRVRAALAALRPR